ncbi:MAG: hypothetical protein ACXW27_09045 [Allosphingosinicella sp.]
MDDVFLPGVTDLFGDPVPRSRGKRGKPPHLPTAENRRFVQLALACGRDEEEIAAALRITARTLNRHYFHELGGKGSARLRLEMKAMAAMVEQVEKGSVAAMALLAKRLDKAGLKQLAHQVADRGQSASAKPAKLGKKEQQRQAAELVGGKFAPPSPPRLIN